MDSVSLQRSLNLAAEHQLSSAGSATSVRSAFDPTAPGLPDKAIAQRWCVGPGGTDGAESDSDYVDARADIDSSDDEYFDALDHTGPPAVRQQEPEPQTNDGDWQVVSRRRSGRKRQESPAGKGGDARVKKGVRDASVSQLPENSSAGSGVTEQHQPVQVCRNDPVFLLSITSCSHWPLCIKSFARLGEVDWASFHSRLVELREYQKIEITRHDFLRFHHMMTEGLQAIKGADDAFFLVGPFKVLMLEFDLSSYALLLSLVIERIVPGFLSMLGERFIGSLSWVDRSQEELLTAVAELLARICQEDECWLDRLGWQKHNKRHQCNLFSAITFLCKRTEKIDMIRSLQQQVSISSLEKYHYARMRSLTRPSVHKYSAPLLRDIRSSLRAIFLWLEGRFSIMPETRDLSRLVASYADVTENVIEVMDGHVLPPNSALFGVWQVVVQWSFRLRSHLRNRLGFDRTITLLNGQLQQIHRWPELESQAFELRLSLLRAMLLKCEQLLLKRDSTLFAQAWREHRNQMVSLLAQCNQFMGKYEMPFVVSSQADRDRNEEEARLGVLLMESQFSRLDCEIRKPSQQRLEKHLQMCREAFTKNWAFSCNYLETGALELAKWCFLAGRHDEAVSCLMGVCFNHVRLSWKKALLLGDHGAYQAAADEFHRIKSLITDSDKPDQPTRDEVDDRIAMTLLQWYQGEHNTDHLISAYRISVDLLGRCDARDRDRFQGVLLRIVNAMKNSGLRFDDYAGQASVLGYLVKEGCSIKSWHHFSNLLNIRHKLGLTDANTVQRVASKIGGRCRSFRELGKMS